MTSAIPLWPETAADEPESAPGEVEYMGLPDSLFPFRQVRNVTRPTLTPFLPEPGRATGTAVVVCPGGAHHMLTIDNEGFDVAAWLVARGIAAFVLKYRLIATPDADDAYAARFLQVMMEPDLLAPLMTPEHRAIVRADGQRAIALVRERAAEWSVAPDRVGILGFSAGGSVAASVGMEHDAASRPAFVAPIYGGLWGDVAVPADAPPLFLALATDDQLGDRIVGASLRLYAAWVAAGRPAELHAYAAGGHGFGMARQGLPSDGWIERFHEWLAAQGLLAASPG